MRRLKLKDDISSEQIKEVIKKTKQNIKKLITEIQDKRNDYNLVRNEIKDIIR